MKTHIDPEQKFSQAMSSFKSLTSPASEVKQPISDDEFVPACQFVTQMIVRAHQYGASFIRLNDFISQLPHLFGFHGAMLSAAPFFFFEFWQSDDSQPNRVTVRQSEGSFDLAKLSEVGVLVSELADGSVPLAKGISRLEQIDALSPPYRGRIMALGYALCGAGFAVLLSAGWRDTVFAALLSLVVYAITIAADRSQWLVNRLNLTAALTASLLANALALLFPGTNAFVITLCAIVVLVPGLALTLGIAELASKLVIPGIGRLVDGVLITFALVVGAAVGSFIVQALWTVTPPVAVPAKPMWIVFLSVILLMLGLGFAFQVRRSGPGLGGSGRRTCVLGRAHRWAVWELAGLISGCPNSGHLRQSVHVSPAPSQLRRHAARDHDFGSWCGSLFRAEYATNGRDHRSAADCMGCHRSDHGNHWRAVYRCFSPSSKERAVAISISNGCGNHPTIAKYHVLTRMTQRHY